MVGAGETWRPLLLLLTMQPSFKETTEPTVAEMREFCVSCLKAILQQKDHKKVPSYIKGLSVTSLIRIYNECGIVRRYQQPFSSVKRQHKIQWIQGELQVTPQWPKGAKPISKAEANQVYKKFKSRIDALFRKTHSTSWFMYLNL